MSTSNSLTAICCLGALFILPIDMLVTSDNSMEKTQVPYELTSGEPVNLTHLISEYILTCGSSNGLCHPPKPPFDINISYATECSTTTNCNKNCSMSQECSPDAKNAYLSVSCVSPVIFSIRSWGYNMVTNCPLLSTVSANTQELCDSTGVMNDSNFFDETYKPVISKQSFIVYRNKFCAACSNDLNTIPFKLELTCDTRLDINLFSSKSEMLESIQANNCSISYAPPEDIRHHVGPCLMTLNYISECNVSGLWFNYDPLIDWACQNFKSFSYMGYKNIFCYICNPSLVSTSAEQVIDSCNMTKQWEKKDTSLERGCLELPTATRTYPFKNRFCQLCNGFSSSFKHFKNFSVKITETDLKQPTTFSIIFREIHNADVSIVYVTRHNADVSSENHTNVDKVNSSIHTVNNSALMELERFCGFSDFCSETYNPLAYIFGFCPSPCKYGGKHCCRKLVSGYDPVIEECEPGRTYDLFSELCENSTIGDVLGNITVKSNITGRVYKNIYCARCNDEVGEIEAERFSIKCTKPLEASLLINFTDLSQIVYANDCKIQTFQLPSSYISVCTHRNHWLRHNKKVLDMCETEHSYFSSFQAVTFNSTTYKNMFCLICNRDVTLYSEEKLISKCNETGLVKFPWNINTENLCQNKTSYPGWYPFRNVFCAACNMDSTISSLASGSGSSQYDFKSPYRIVFSLRDDHFPTGHTVPYQTGKIPTIFCAKGRELKGDECKIIVEETSSLYYDMTFGLRFKETTYPALISVDLQCLRQEILKQFYIMGSVIFVTKLRIDIASVGDCHKNIIFKKSSITSQCPDYQSESIQRNSSLSSIVNNKTTWLDISVDSKITAHVSLSVWNTENRTELEDALLALRHFVVNVSSTAGFIQLESFPTDSRSELCTTPANDSTCHYRILPGYTSIAGGIKIINVDKLLTCALTEIENDKDNLETLCINNLTFQVSVDKKKIILCIKDWEALSLRKFPAELDLFQYAHGLFSMICTLLSATCLFLTFFTYLMFKSLRNIPGINNMNLVFSMFWAQLLLQFGLWQTEYPNVCIFLGIANHYFWLASFFSMNICSYHMFKVFHTQMLVSRSMNKRTVIYYSIYIYGAPFITISVFLIVILVTNDYNVTGYGMGICFLSNHMFVLLMFVAPAILIIVADTFFFAVAYWHIRSSPRVRNTGERNDFKIYLKLMTVTGVAWIILFIDTLNPLSIFSFIATLASALQGVYIFIAFICTKKIFFMYRSKFCSKKHHVQFKKKQSKFLSKSDTTSSEWIQVQLDRSKETFV